MYILCKQGVSSKNRFYYFGIAIILYSVIFGLRYGVGVDYFSYLNDYLIHQSTGKIIQGEDTEPGFLAIRTYFAISGYHFSIYFGFIAFIQLLLIFLSVKQDKEIYPYLVLSFTLLCVWLTYANGLRQQMAFCLFACALSLFSNKGSRFMILLLMLLSISMHKSAYLLAPLLFLLFLFRYISFSNIKLHLIFLICAIVIGRTSYVRSIIGVIEEYAQHLEILGYNEYFSNKNLEELLFQTTVRNGVGFFILLIFDIVLIYFSNSVMAYSKSNFYKSMYLLYYIGAFFHYLLITSSIIQRVNYYFYGFQFIVMAYTLYYLNKKNKLFFYGLMTLLIICFIGYMYRMYDNTAAYYFFWQKDLYQLNH